MHVAASLLCTHMPTMKQRILSIGFFINAVSGLIVDLTSGWELTDDRCQEIELDTREALGKAEQAGASDSDRTLDTNWGFPNENFPVVFL
eukprot:1036945-Rhodomonas_salina.2